MVRYLARFAAVRSRRCVARPPALAGRRAALDRVGQLCLALTSESSEMSGDDVLAPTRPSPRPRSASPRRGSPRPRSLPLDRPRRRRLPSARATALDLVAQLDERQLASGDLVGQAPALLRVLDLHQLVGVRQRVFAQRHEFADLGRSVGQAQPVLEIALVLAELLGQLADAVAVLADHSVVHRRLVERRQVLALEVLDDRDLERRVVVDLLDRAPGSLRGRRAFDARQRRSPAISWYGSVAERSDEDRLEDAVLADRCGQLVERRLLERQARLLRVRLDVVDRDDAGPRRDRVGLSGDSRLTMAGESSRSSDSRRAAAARKSVLAKVDHLPGKLAVGAGGLGLCPHTW